MSIVAGAKTVTIHLTAPGERGEGRREEDAKLAKPNICRATERHERPEPGPKICQEKFVSTKSRAATNKYYLATSGTEINSPPQYFM